MSDPQNVMCDHFIESDDPWAGTYCKLLHGHDGEHSAHYPRGELWLSAEVQRLLGQLRAQRVQMNQHLSSEETE